MQKSNKEIISRFMSAYNSHDIDSMLKLIHPYILFKNVSSGRVNVQTVGREEFIKLIKKTAEIFKDREQKIVSYEEADDRVKVEVQYHAKVEIDQPDGKKSKDDISMHSRSEFTIKDGLIYSMIDKS